MNTQVNKFPNALWWVAGIAVTLFSAAGISAFMGWTLSSMADEETARSAPATQSSNAVPEKCRNCGQIESVREVVKRGEGTGLGAVGGAVVGGVLGHQFGDGRGKDVATAVGVVGGAVAGNEIEKQSKSTKSYEIIVRLDDGSSQKIRAASLPSWQPGDQIKVVDGSIQSNR